MQKISNTIETTLEKEIYRIYRLTVENHFIITWRSVSVEIFELSKKLSEDRYQCACAAAVCERANLKKCSEIYVDLYISYLK